MVTRYDFTNKNHKRNLSFIRPKNFNGSRNTENVEKGCNQKDELYIRKFSQQLIWGGGKEIGVIIHS